MHKCIEKAQIKFLGMEKTTGNFCIYVEKGGALSILLWNKIYWCKLLTL